MTRSDVLRAAIREVSDLISARRVDDEPWADLAREVARLEARLEREENE